MKRYTVNETITWEGKGLHSGEDCVVRLHPSDNGVQFRCGDVTWPARWDYVKDTSRCSSTGSDGKLILTVEHLLSALYGMQVTDAVIEVDGGEIPALDGSAKLFVEAIDKVGVNYIGEMNAPKLTKPITVTNGDKIASVYPSGNTITGLIHFDHPLVGAQAGTFELTKEIYIKEIASARTFAFDYEVEALLAQGLAGGGSLDNAIVIQKEKYSTPLRYSNELVRHKLLDMLGDLMMVGIPLYGVSFLGVKMGHALNIKLASEVARAIEMEG